MECDLGKIAIHYETFGEGIPIIMLHGWYLDHRSMVADLEPVFKTRRGWKRIYPDLPGMGRTPGMGWIANNDYMLAIVQDFIDKVIPKQRFVVAGYSYGGYLARGIVYRKSAMMDGLLLIAPIITPTQLGPPLKLTLIKDEALVSKLTPEESSVFSLAVVQSQEALDHLRTYVLPAIRTADIEFVKKLRGEFSFDVDALPEPFDKPTLILMGRQDSYVGYRKSWSIIENYPRATFAVLDRSGHFLGRPGEQEQLFVALINEWLDRVKEHARSMRR
jgi:pimeloyl-ACP methyl ester carboxylesterase